MSNTPHELAEEFPEAIEKIHLLKASNSHFAKLFEAYHEVNRAIHRAETNVEPHDDFTISGMRKQRMKLKDEIAGILAS
jgi:uncharacterized protein YdcH (DUF465 family)